MEDLESSLAEIVDQLQIKLYEDPERPIPENVLSEPLKCENISEGVLSSSFSLDTELSLGKRELLLKGLLNELVTNAGDTDMRKLSVLLDFCYYLKYVGEEDESKVWAALFFDLTATCILTLTFPHELGQFYTYLRSRLSWYLEGLSKEPVSNGGTNLKMGIRPPAAKLFFSIDTFFKNIDSHSLFITPNHFELVHKLLWWISQLIPINDHCNINRRAKIMDEYPETFWAPHLPALPSSPTILSDWTKICDDFFLHPLHWLFSHPRDKLTLESVVHRFVDEIFVYETELYNLIKEKNEKSAKQEAAVNGKDFYPLNFIDNVYDEPDDSRNSILPSKVEFWKEFNSESTKSENIIQLLPLELDLFDLRSFQDRIEAYEYDYFRKLVILQIYLTFYLLKEIISNDTLVHYYGKIFNQSSLSHSSKWRVEYGDNVLNKNDSAINFLTKKLNRISSFYEIRDRQFYELLNHLAQNELDALNQKVVDFSNLKDIHWPSDLVTVPTINNAFKKFGWIKLGNKKLDGLWKVQSGLDLARKYSENNRQDPSELYDTIISGYKDKTEKTDDDESTTDNVIVKQWQNLRSLRPEYLFEFNKVSEKTTLAGFANEELIRNDIESKKRRLAERIESKKKKHSEQVAEAEQFFKDKEQERKDLLQAKIKSQRETLENGKNEKTIAPADQANDSLKRGHDSPEADANEEEQAASKKQKLEKEVEEPDADAEAQKEKEPESEPTDLKTIESTETEVEVPKEHEGSSHTE
ncbi:Hpr1 [Kluyveromyces lactis]|nr:Hpr1 [Kluyveromyces lactis]